MPYEFVVKPQTITVDQVPCQGGTKVWPHATLEYELYGAPLDKKLPVMVILPFFLGNAHAGGYAKEDPKTKKLAVPGYWNQLIGPGNAFDTSTHTIISFGPLIGSHFGPGQINPTTKAPYGGDFPNFTFDDYAKIQKAALAKLGVTHVHVVAGASMGSLQAWHMFADDVNFVDKLVLVVPGGEELPEKTRVFADRWVNMLQADPGWKGGNYYPHGYDPSKPGAKYNSSTLVTVLSEFWYRCQYPLAEQMLWDPQEEYWEEFVRAWIPANPKDDVLIGDAIKAAQASKKSVDEDFNKTLSLVIKGTDFNVLLWQLRTINSFSVQDRLAEAQNTISSRENPLGVFIVYAPDDDIFTTASIAKTSTTDSLRHVDMRVIKLPPNKAHATGLRDTALGSVHPQLDAALYLFIHGRAKSVAKL